MRTGIAVFSVAVLAVGAPTASASVITLTFPFDLSASASTGFITGPGDVIGVSSRDLFFPHFDPTLGTLRDVSISFASTATIRSVFEVQDPSTGFLHEENVSGRGRARVAPQLWVVDWFSTGRSTSLVRFPSCSEDDGYCLTDVSVFAPFDGVLNLSGISLVELSRSIRVRVLISAHAFVELCEDDEDECRQMTMGRMAGSVSVHYLYDDIDDAGGAAPPPATIPEPGTIMLLGLGLALMILPLRR